MTLIRTSQPADHLHEQPLRSRSSAQEAARHARLAGHVVERRGGGAARADARAHRLDDPLRLLSLEPARGLDRCLHRGAILAGRPTTRAGHSAIRPSVRQAHLQDGGRIHEGRPKAPLEALASPGPPGGAHRFARSRFRRGRGCTRTPPRRRTGRRGPFRQTLAQREACADEPGEEPAAGMPLLLLAAQRVGSLAQRDGRLAKLLLRLLVLGQRPDGPLPFDMRE